MAEAKAILRFVRVAPRKARVVVDMIRGQHVPQALAMLKHTPRHAAKVVEKLLRSAVANAEQKEMGDSNRCGFPGRWSTVGLSISDFAHDRWDGRTPYTSERAILRSWWLRPVPARSRRSHFH